MKNDNIRAIRLNLSFNKKWYPTVIFVNFFNIFSPYFEIILSSLILTEIYGGVSDVRYFVFLVVLLLAGNFLLAILQQVMVNANDSAGKIRDKNTDRYMGNLYMHYEYGVLESESFTQLRRTVSEHERMGEGRNLLMRGIQDLVYYIVSLGIALYFIIELFVKLATHEFNILSVLLLAAIVALAITNVKYSAWAQKKELEMSQKIGDALTDESRFDNAVGGYQIGKDVRLYQLDKLVLNFRKKYLLEDHLKYFKWFMDRCFRNDILTELTSFLLKFVIYIFIMINIAKGVLPVGSIIKYVGIVEMVVSGIRGLVVTISSIKNNTPCVTDYMKQFDYPKEPEKTDQSDLLTVPKNATIEFVDVSFQYDGTDFWALRHVSLRIDSQKCYALVGENGSGKTTLIKLLCRLYHPNEGKILLNGVDILSYDMDEYRKLLSTVFQDFKLFAFTLGENIALSESYDPDKVQDCIRKVNFLERYEEMEDGLDTNLYRDFDDEGVEISGGKVRKLHWQEPCIKIPR
jgi:ATP-binding cassette subfamily B protein